MRWLGWWPCGVLFHLWWDFKTKLGYIKYRTCAACLKSQKKVLDHPWRDV